ncbi:zinc-binding dehydrogenase [Rubellimicrobium rubrum]|uniref:enoyl-[acyl-carrier-protein] reductase n=1 Tax=Rubellimicrobium rubrum TaxID=2585369 RepID=A0A5C4MWS0_9RHOB|nr:zinc-binding dehydrogenase [Rubellimicrobium rubrum]TNC49163.1 zinc-binding dehydrogenase [Rubellimicrobium rubrum]
MRSVVYESFGRPEQVLKVAERPRPEPGPGQVLVRMVLSPIHNHDLMTTAGSYGIRPALPAVGGTEALGLVEVLGEGVSHLRAGQRVAGGASETWAEFYLADAARLVPVPDGVSDKTACQLIAMPLSAKMILAELGLKPGDWLVQNAANGAVGRLVSRFGEEQGIRVLSLVRRDAAVEELRALGIDRVVSTEGADWPERARAFTGGAPILHGIDSLAGEGPSQLALVMADGGTISSFGAMTNQPLQVPPALLLFRRITVNGFWAAKPRLSPQEIGRMVGELVQDAAAGRLALPVSGTYPLQEIAEAVKASGEAGRSGKVVLTP